MQPPHGPPSNWGRAQVISGPSPNEWTGCRRSHPSGRALAGRLLSFAAVVPLSVLDLAPIVEGGDTARALANSVDLARHAERWGYRRFWLAEHHNMPGI